MATVDRDTAARHAARKLYQDNECEIDSDARVVFLDEPGTEVAGWAWVQTWRLVPADEIAAVEKAAAQHEPEEPEDDPHEAARAAADYLNKRRKEGGV